MTRQRLLIRLVGCRLGRLDPNAANRSRTVKSRKQQQVLSSITTDDNNIANDQIETRLPQLVWEIYMGCKMGRRPCYCCGLNIITSSNFECGHVMPPSQGGSRDNLRPICKECHEMIGPHTHMHDFQKYYNLPILNYFWAIYGLFFLSIMIGIMIIIINRLNVQCLESDK